MYFYLCELEKEYERLKHVLSKLTDALKNI